METSVNSSASNIPAWVKRITGLLYRPDQTNLSTWVQILWYGGLLLGGAFIWGFILNWGRLGFDYHDWSQEGPRFAFLRQALLESKFPLFIGSELAATERFLAIPDTVISPQILLLRFLEPGAFILVNTLFLYTLGFIGLLLLRRRMNWSPVTFLVVFLLFSMNGHPIAQIAVGHSMWNSYFLLPFFVLLVIRLLEDEVGWGWVIQMALLQLILFLQGGYHFFNWSLMFLLLLGIFSFRHIRPVLKALLFSILFSLPRILPAALEFVGEKRPFISGYFSVTDLVSAFVTLKSPEHALEGMYSALGWWEVDVYTGLLGLLFLIFFGVYLSWKIVSSETFPRILLAPILAMTILSLGKIFQPVTMLPIPLVGAERVSSRFVIVPVVVLIVVAGTQFERFIQKKSWGFGLQIASLAGFAVLGHDLLQHARLWRVENMGLLFPSTPVDIRAQVLARSDPAYINAILVGLGIALAAFIVSIVLLRRERKQVP
jgi:hypothetical protein